MAIKYYVVAPINLDWAITKNKNMDYQFHTFPKEYPPVICDSYSVARGWLKEFLKTNKHVNYGIFELKYESFFNKELGTPIIKMWNDEGELIPQGKV